MISVLDHIEYLMIEHDCVIVPGLGAFISQYSMYRNMQTGVAESVKRSISFNRSVDYNDGLLANSIMRRENVDFDIAKTEIDNYVRALFGQLKYEGEVPVGRLGYFSSANEGVLEFYPFVSRKTNDEYFGLMVLTMKPLSVMIEEEVRHDVRKSSNIVGFARRFMQAAASIILLIAMSLVLSTPIVDEATQNYANFNAFSLKNSEENNKVRDLYIAVPVVKQEVKMESKPIATKGNYCLVVASLTSQKQVEKFMQENKTMNFEVAKCGSKYRVYIARGSYEEMCKLKTGEYASTDAWVTRI